LSLIDAVMPDVVESRKQAAAKAHNIKSEAANTNGEETSHSGISKLMYFSGTTYDKQEFLAARYD